jgi:hypothetical protein
MVNQLLITLALYAKLDKYNNTPEGRISFEEFNKEFNNSVVSLSTVI